MPQIVTVPPRPNFETKTRIGKLKFDEMGVLVTEDPTVLDFFTENGGIPGFKVESVAKTPEEARAEVERIEAERAERERKERERAEKARKANAEKAKQEADKLKAIEEANAARLATKNVEKAE